MIIFFLCYFYVASTMNEEAGASLHPAISSLGGRLCIPAQDSFHLGVPDSLSLLLQVKGRSYSVLLPEHPGPLDFYLYWLFPAQTCPLCPSGLPHPPTCTLFLSSHSHTSPGAAPAFPSGGPDSASLTASLRIVSFTKNKQTNKAPN